MKPTPAVAAGAPSLEPAPAAATRTRPVEPTEAAMVRSILLAARITHWRVAHFRAALTKHGWRTAVQGDGAGFPDLVMVHPKAGLVWWVELKSSTGRLDPDQKGWRDDLQAAGERWLLVKGKTGLDQLIHDMAHLPQVVRP